MIDEQAEIGGRERAPEGESRRVIDAGWLRQVVLDAGGDDVGFVSIDREEIAAEKPYLIAAVPETRALLSIVCRLNPDNVRSPARSIGNLEFHRNYHHIDAAAVPAGFWPLFP